MHVGDVTKNLLHMSVHVADLVPCNTSLLTMHCIAGRLWA